MYKRQAQYYKGLAEITQVYENTSTETDELESQSTKKLQELCSKKIFGMDIATVSYTHLDVYKRQD